MFYNCSNDCSKNEEKAAAKRDEVKSGFDELHKKMEEYTGTGLYHTPREHKNTFLQVREDLIKLLIKTFVYSDRKKTKGKEHKKLQK